MKNKFIAGCISILLSISSVLAEDERMTDREFGQYVFEILEKEYKEKTFEKTNDNLVINSGEIQLGLESLLKKYYDSGSTKDKFRTVVKEHFESMFTQLEMQKQLENLKWESAKVMLRPMFAPVEYAEKIDIYHTKVDSNIMAAYVIDIEKSYRYVSREDIKRWGVSEADIEDNAGKNLNEASKNAPVQGSLNEVKFLIINANDGYDAARLLSQDFRDFLGSKLGYPFHAGIPNRDFLIVWALENPEEMKSGFVESIKSDFNEKPYPLTPNVLEVRKDSIIVKN